MSRVLRLTDRNFEVEICQSRVPVLVDFWTSWCLPCKAVEPLLDELADEYDGRVEIGRINVDQNPKTRGKYQIMGVPTFILFQSGKEMQRRIGAQSKAQLEEMLRSDYLEQTNSNSDQ